MTIPKNYYGCSRNLTTRGSLVPFARDLGHPLQGKVWSYNSPTSMLRHTNALTTRGNNFYRLHQNNFASTNHGGTGGTHCETKITPPWGSWPCPNRRTKFEQVNFKRHNTQQQGTFGIKCRKLSRWGRPTLTTTNNHQHSQFKMGYHDSYQPTPQDKGKWYSCDDEDVWEEPRLKVMMGTLGYVIASVEMYQNQLYDVYNQGERMLAGTEGNIERVRNELASPHRTQKLDVMVKRRNILNDMDRLLQGCTEDVANIRANLQAAYNAITALDGSHYIAPPSGSQRDTIDQVRTRYAMASTGAARCDKAGSDNQCNGQESLNEKKEIGSSKDEEITIWTNQKFDKHPENLPATIHGNINKMSQLCLCKGKGKETKETKANNTNLYLLIEELTKELGQEDDQLNLKACSLLTAYLRKCTKCACQNFGQHEEDCPNFTSKRADFIIPSDDEQLELLKDNYRKMVQEDPDHEGEGLIPYFTTFMKHYSRKQTNEQVDEIFNNFKQVVEVEADVDEKQKSDGNFHKVMNNKKNDTFVSGMVTDGERTQKPPALTKHTTKNNPDVPKLHRVTHHRAPALLEPLPPLRHLVTVSTTGTTMPCPQSDNKDHGTISPLTEITAGHYHEQAGTTRPGKQQTNTTLLVTNSTHGPTHTTTVPKATDNKCTLLFHDDPYTPEDVTNGLELDQATKDYY